LLEAEQSSQCVAHLGSCAACEAEYVEILKLQQQLAAKGRAAAGVVSLVEPVMRRVHQQRTQPERINLMNRLFTPWGFGLSAVAGAAAIIVASMLIATRGEATPAQVMTRGAKAVAKLTNIHMRAQLRTLPADNFAMIDPAQDFSAIELWKEFGPGGKWRIDKP